EELIGRCCLPDGGCDLLDEEECLEAQDGLQWTAGEPCGGDGDDDIDDACLELLAACCLTDGSCEMRSEASCLTDGGTWAEGMTCADMPCGPAPIPTMSEWLLLLLAAVTAGAGVLVLRRS
ncbi:MAG: IPTL-CTERM sorting domain-containing protein, partial [Acidobacteriota bacterium]